MKKKLKTKNILCYFFLSKKRRTTIPATPATKIIHTGDTPKYQIKNAATTEIHTAFHVKLAVFANLNTGTAIKATTAGRAPHETFFPMRAILDIE